MSPATRWRIVRAAPAGEDRLTAGQRLPHHRAFSVRWALVQPKDCSTAEAGLGGGFWSLRTGLVRVQEALITGERNGGRTEVVTDE